ncbi:MAG: ATP-grasp domain-containing protein [Patescibacteria group bacterium]
MSFSNKIRVAVLRGGPSPAYEESLKTGDYVLSLLREMPEKYDPIDIFISRDGEWHYGGVSSEPHQILSDVDAVWNGLHGTYGEDGGVQKLLNSLQKPFTGSGITASAFAHNKDLSKKLYKRHSLLTPDHTVVSQESFSDEELIKIFRTYLHPVIVKPATGVSALGIRMAHTFHELKEAIEKTFEHSSKVMVEEYVKGVNATCAVIENGKGERFYTLIPSGRHPIETNKQIEEMAKKAHEILGQRHYSASDFVITPSGRVYILETNSLPELHEDSHLHHSLHATGWQPKDFCDHCLKLALNQLD